MSSSYLERIAEALIKEANLPEPMKEFRICTTRRWRGDMVWFINQPNGKIKKVLLEIEGGTFLRKGRHQTGVGYQADCEKYNEAALLGYLVIRVTRYHIINGQMIEWLKRALENDL